MISKVNGYNPIINNNEIFIYDKHIIEPGEIKEIILPYRFTEEVFNPFFIISKKLALLGLSCLWNNLNEESSKKYFTFVIMNNNISNNMTDLETIIGSRLSIELRSNSEFGIIKTYNKDIVQAVISSMGLSK